MADDKPQKNVHKLRCSVCPFSTLHAGAFKRHFKTWHLTDQSGSSKTEDRPGNKLKSYSSPDTLQSMLLPVTAAARQTSTDPHLLNASYENSSLKQLADASEALLLKSVVKDFAGLLPETGLGAKLNDGHSDPADNVDAPSNGDCVCHICNKSYPSQHSLELHIDFKHTGQSLLGAQSSFKPSQSQSQDLPQKDTQFNLEYKCSMCNLSFRNLNQYRNHLSTHKDLGIAALDGQRNVTDLCPATLAGQVKVEPHVRMYSCHMCGRQFKWRSSLKYHRDKGCVIKRLS